MVERAQAPLGVMSTIRCAERRGRVEDGVRLAGRAYGMIEVAAEALLPAVASCKIATVLPVQWQCRHGESSPVDLLRVELLVWRQGVLCWAVVGYSGNMVQHHGWDDSAPY